MKTKGEPVFAAGHMAAILAFLFVALSCANAQFTLATNNGALTITRYTGEGGALVIPGTIDGLPVISIGNSAFQGAALTSVAIGENVATLQPYAFNSCHVLNSVTIPSTLTNIDATVFNNCTALETYEVAVGNPAFSSSSGVIFNSSGTLLIRFPLAKSGSYSIPPAVTGFADNAFASCSGVTNISFPDTFTTVPAGAFAFCDSLQGVMLPATITSIQGSAFAFCRGLQSFPIPDTVTNIDSLAFDSCINLTSIVIGAANPTYASIDGVLFTKDLRTIVSYPAGRSGTYAIPATVTAIGPNAFWSCYGLSAITIPSTVTTVGSAAFGLTGLGTITIAGPVTFLSTQTFWNCTNLTFVSLPTSLAGIGNSAFASCPRLSAILCHGSPPSLGSSALPAQTFTWYRLATSTGWGTTYALRPVRVWGPQLETSGPTIGITTNGFGFNISGASNAPIVIEASIDLSPNSWIQVQTCTLTNGSLNFYDSNWTSFATRFYRIRWP